MNKVELLGRLTKDVEMEEDIKVLEEYIEALRHPMSFKYTNEQKAQAIENLIKGYKELEEKNKKQKEHITNINKRHTNIREQLKLLQAHRLRKYVMSNYIEKSKVTEKIKEINDEELNFNENDYWIEQEMKGYAIGHIQELLQEGDDK